MFFFGILSSIFPYIATIVVMCVCFLAGQGSDVKMDDFVDIKDKTIIIEQQINDSQFSRKSTISYTSYVSTTLEDNTNNEVNTDLEPKIVWLCPQAKYCSVISLADSNKAPPYFI